ncbi:MAG: type II toxin-antitoxin system HigB family toxin [Chitinophagales bacterium]|nr:type II toxin-antitoxin system HigB family toxin [Chitinophagales bacterium]
MRIIARKTLREFWEEYPDSETPLKLWFKEIKKAQWRNFNRLKEQFGNASVVGNDRVVFNIKGNDYRLIATIDYEKQILWVRFIGTHKAYDKINAKTI